MSAYEDLGFCPISKADLVIDHNYPKGKTNKPEKKRFFMDQVPIKPWIPPSAETRRKMHELKIKFGLVKADQ